MKGPIKYTVQRCCYTWILYNTFRVYDRQ